MSANLDRFSCGVTPKIPMEVGCCEVCSGVIYDYELDKCESCDVRIHEGCSKKCDICGRKGCKNCLHENQGLLYCEKCHEEKIEEFTKRLSMPLAEALSPFSYWLAGESEENGQRIFEFLSSEAPRLEVRISTESEGENT